MFSAAAAADTADQDKAQAKFEVAVRASGYAGPAYVGNTDED